ncbi:hypothetical protein CXF71_07845 [Colwellia sp. 12G3]|nr:hypothetical protein CXF71_07845 [Colwellia sp. 12G3]
MYFASFMNLFSFWHYDLNSVISDLMITTIKWSSSAPFTIFLHKKVTNGISIKYLSFDTLSFEKLAMMLIKADYCIQYQGERM